MREMKRPKDSEGMLIKSKDFTNAQSEPVLSHMARRVL
jgi:hypothetical protein